MYPFLNKKLYKTEKNGTPRHQRKIGEPVSDVRGTVIAALIGTLSERIHTVRPRNVPVE